MPRIARLVVPGYPHHVTQRGNRRQRTFFEKADFEAYVSLLCELKERAAVDIWGYCMMPNHVHLVAVPQRRDSLAKLLGVAHHRYARHVNSRYGWQGHLWQERFHSTVLDERHLLAAVRYVELNPVRGGLCRRAEEWRWSSARAHLHNAPDRLVNVTAMRERISDWQSYLADDGQPDLSRAVREHTRTGRPAGADDFIDSLEELTGRRLRRRKPGPAPKNAARSRS